VREQNQIRRNPQKLIDNLEEFLSNRNQYYSKKVMMQEAAGDRQLEDVVSHQKYLFSIMDH